MIKLLSDLSGQQGSDNGVEVVIATLTAPSAPLIHHLHPCVTALHNLIAGRLNLGIPFGMAPGTIAPVAYP